MTFPAKWPPRSISGFLITVIAVAYGYAALFGLLD